MLTPRPYPDNSKAYQEHKAHTKKCKWCRWDRVYQYEKMIEEITDDLKKRTKLKENSIVKKKCRTCLGYGLWAIADHPPIGKLDSRNMPSVSCPECGQGGKHNVKQKN